MFSRLLKAFVFVLIFAGDACADPISISIAVGTAIGVGGAGVAAGLTGAAIMGAAGYGAAKLMTGGGQKQSINPLTGQAGNQEDAGVSGSTSTDRGRAFLASLGSTKGFGKNPNTARSFLSSL